MGLPLSDLARGQSGYIEQVSDETGMARRLSELGMLAGTRIECELISPAGDPVAYRVRGALIALRRRDARVVQVALRGEGTP